MVQIAAVLCTIIFAGLAVFQVLLSLGFPLGEATMGGFHRVLPKPMRFVSLFSAFLLLFMALVFLQQGKVVSIGFQAHVLAWIFTGYLGLNTLVNLFSKSKKERLFMTPISAIAFLLCLLVSAH